MFGPELSCIPVSQMAEAKTVAIVPLNGTNYSTWKIQCRMALMKDGIWKIVDGTETAPDASDAAEYAKFISRRDRALAVIVLSVAPALLYLIGDPQCPVMVWKKLADQFQKKSWANKLELRRKLYSLRLKEGESVQKHIKSMTETFESLSVIGDPVSDEDRVVYLLASLPESFTMLVTAFEASAEVPKMEVVTERLLCEERKMKERGGSEVTAKAMPSAQHPARAKPKVKCYHCGKRGHIKRNCRVRIAEEKTTTSGRTEPSQKANRAALRDSSVSDDDEDALVVSHALAANATNHWIVDSGATCHMCNNERQFSDFRKFDMPQQVALGDGHELEAVGRGTVYLTLNLPEGKTCRRKLRDVLCVPRLAYNLVSVSKVTDTGKTTKFDDTRCRIIGQGGTLLAVATKVGSLYYLDCQEIVGGQRLNTAEMKPESKESVWHRRFGHLGVRSLQKLARDNMIDSFDFDASSDLTFCETCVGGKHHKSQFPKGTSTRSNEPLGLIHSDICGKLNSKSLSGAEYFLTFVDDKTRYVWVYFLKHKDEAFQRFVEWKALVEKSSGHQVKILRTDNGGEYTSTQFEGFLKAEGIRHERTVLKTPEQNGVAERLNRTLVETTRSMLIDAKLPQQFWAEALSTAVYLRNRSPTKAVDGMTPCEAWTRKKPEVAHLRVFGCEAYAHIPKDERRKLDPKATKCILLGYGEETKGYRLYDTEKRRVFHSRDVQFNEAMREEQLEPAEQEIDQLVELEFLDEVPRNDDPPEEAPPIAPVEPEQPPRRSERVRRPPDYYVNVTNELPKEPLSVEEALSSPEKEKWKGAMASEMKSLQENDVWELVHLPEGQKALGSKWVYKVKTGVDGSIERYKARLVAQGYQQKYGTDYDQTFCPVVRLESFRTLVALSVQYGLKIHQVDVTTAFLNGELEEEVYMKQPPGFSAEGQENLVCKLKKSIYGLKQSPRCWNSTLHNQLKSMGFLQTTSDPCIYRDSGGEPFFIGVYVDDIILAGDSQAKMKEVKEALAQKFDIKDMGKLHYFLGIKVIQDEKTGDIWIGQPAYAETLLKRFKMDQAKPVSTPVSTEIKFVNATEDDEYVDQQVYQSGIGSLLYLSVGTRPDITFAVSNLAKFCTKLTQQHWTGVKRIMRYLKGTIHYGILYTKQSSQECIGYSDADWAGDVNDRRSTSGYVFQISGGSISWKSRKQPSVALSTAEAEYMALAGAAQEALWLKQLTSELGSTTTEPFTIYEDNQSTISMAKNPQFHGRAKHVAIKYHFIREHVNDGSVRLEYCPTKRMVADILTKGLPRVQFVKLRKMAGVVELSR